MKKFKRYLSIAIVILIFVVLVTVVLVSKHRADNHSRTQAQSAAAVYVLQAKKYLSTVGKDLVFVGSPTTLGQQAIDATVTVQSDQKALLPKLIVVHGAGVSVPAYKTALHYQTEIASLQPKVASLLAADSTFAEYLKAYTALVNAQTEITKGALNSGDPVTAITTTIVTPLTPAQTAFNKVKIPNGYSTFNTDLKNTFTVFLSGANELIAMYKSGSLHSVSYDTYTPLNKSYQDSLPLAKDLNQRSTSLGNTLLKLAK